MTEARAYFQAYAGHYWTWEDEGEVVALRWGDTVAFRQLLKEIIEMLAPQGLPPFDALLLAIIATDEKSDRMLDSLTGRPVLVPGPDKPYAQAAMSFLRIVSDLPRNYKRGKKRMLVLQALFEDCHNRLAANLSALVARDMYQGINLAHVMGEQVFNDAVFQESLKTIALIGRQYPSAESILKKVAGLVPLPEPPAVDTSPQLPDNGQSDLLTQLINNRDTFPVAALVKPLWAGLNIPLHSSVPSQQPLGGVSDLSNKGHLSHLLLTEYANDDLLFISRLANNEALYLHREIPPLKNRTERILLVDVTLKNWGVPKNIGLAAALAISNHPKTDMACTTFAVGQAAKQIDLNSLDGMIDAIQVLDTSVHPAKGLEQFLSGHTGKNDLEIIFIAESSSMKHTAVQKVLSEHGDKVRYMILTHAKGQLEVFKRENKGRSRLQEIVLPLDKLWNRPVPLPSLPNNTTIHSIPILLRVPHNARKLLQTADDSYFLIADNRTLFKAKSRLFTTSSGWKLVCTGLPNYTGIVEIGVDSHGIYRMLIYNPSQKQIHLVDLSDGTQAVIPFPQYNSHCREFTFEADNFVHIGQRAVYLIDCETGSISQEDLSEDFIGRYHARVEATAELNKTKVRGTNILKHVDEVWISSAGYLMLKQHALLLRNHQHFKLVLEKNTDRSVTAVKSSDYTFEFPDGSQVEVFPSGYMTLTSGSPDIPVMYVPLELQSAICVATHGHFAGNRYYFDYPLYNLVLCERGSSKGKAVSILRSRFGLSPEQCTKLEGELPQVVTTCSEEAGLEVIRLLKEAGATAELSLVINDVINRPLEIATPAFIFENCLTPFISHIMKYGS